MKTSSIIFLVAAGLTIFFGIFVEDDAFGFLLWIAVAFVVFKIIKNEMKISSTTFLVAAGLTIFVGLFDDDAYGFLLWIAIAFVVFKIFAGATNSTKDTIEYSGNGVDANTYISEKRHNNTSFRRLLALLIKKGVVTHDEHRSAGVFDVEEEKASDDPAQKAADLYTIPLEEPELKKVVPTDAPRAADYEQPDDVADEQIGEQTLEDIKPEETTEFQFSSSWFVWIGIFAVMLGVGFFLKYSFENDLIDETGRVILGIIVGCVFLGLGEYFNNKYEKYSHVLSGGGIGLLYLSLYGTLYYELIDPLATLFFMGLVTATSLMLSIRYDSKGIAALGVIGGYGTPFFFGKIVEGFGGLVLLNYLVVLNVGVLVLAYFKKWRDFLWVGFISTVLLMGIWLASPFYDTSKITLAIAYLTVFWMIYTSAVLIFYYFNERTPRTSDMILLTLIGLQYAGVVYLLLIDMYGEKQSFFGLIPLLLAVAYTGISYVGASLRPRERTLTLFPMGMAILFITLIFPFEFEGKWLTVAWLVESSIIGFVALALRSQSLARCAMPVYLLGILFLFFDVFSSEMVRQTATPILNERFFLYGVAITAAFCLMYVFTKFKNLLPEEDNVESVESVEEPIGEYFDDSNNNEVSKNTKKTYARDFFIFANVLIGMMVVTEMGIFSKFIADPEHVFYPIFNIRFFLLLAVIIYAYGVAFFSLNKKEGGGQMNGRVTISFVMANILILISGISELGDYYRFREEYMAIFNARTLIFAIGVAYAGTMSYFLYKGIPNLFRAVKGVAIGMFVVVNILLFIYGISEIADYYSHLEEYKAIFNIRLLLMLLGVAYAGAVSFVLYRKVSSNEELLTAPGFFIAANVLLLLLGIIEIVDYHNHILGAAHNKDVSQQMIMFITLFLAIYGFIALAIGIATKFATLRKIAIVVLGIAIIKVFLVDIWFQDTMYRIIALLSLGTTLLVVGYLYYRYKERIISIIKSDDDDNNQIDKL